jgi:fumarate reductase flavoprotein subunit
LLNGARERFMHRYDPRAERATRDIVSRAMFAEMRAGSTTPHGGMYISMAHLGPERVKREFKGMVERCADCGFDLAGGLVEVVPTAHYMMGGVEFNPDCSTALAGLFAAGEDTGGVHGANRLGGNGVANSTVFGGVAGDSMAAWVKKEGAFREPDEAAVASAIDRAELPLRLKSSAANLEEMRERLYDLMWEKVGIVRDEAGLQEAAKALTTLAARLDEFALAGTDRRFNLTWHDWLNLGSLVEVSKIICACALTRRNSRGAHFRGDFPAPGDLSESGYVRAQRKGFALEISDRPVRFTRVKPGENLLAT